MLPACRMLVGGARRRHAGVFYFYFDPPYVVVDPACAACFFGVNCMLSHWSVPMKQTVTETGRRARALQAAASSRLAGGAAAAATKPLEAERRQQELPPRLPSDVGRPRRPGSSTTQSAASGSMPRLMHAKFGFSICSFIFHLPSIIYFPGSLLPVPYLLVELALWHPCQQSACRQQS